MAIKFLSGLNLSNVTAGSLLKLDSNGNIVAAVDGTDYNTGSADSWSDVGVNIYRNSDVRIGTFQSGVAPSARLHVFDYQTTDPKLLIEDGNTGDASMQFKISTQQYTIGIDNSDSDKFIIANAGGFNLAANTHALEISTNGKITVPAHTSHGAIRLEMGGYNRLRFNGGIDLLGYGSDHLWVIGNSTTNTINLGSDWNWDTQVAISYTPGTVGNAGGVMILGQTEKNNANWTHGITSFYTNGSERMRINSYGAVLIGTTNTNSDKADFAVGSPQISWYSGQIQIGGTDMNWNAKGYVDSGVFNLAAWDGHIRLFTQGGASATSRDIILSPQATGGAATERARLKGDTGNFGIGTNSPSEKLEVVGTIQATSAGTATLILRGDSGNSGDTGQLDSTIKMLHDDMNHGILLETRNYAGAQSFEIKSLVSGTETSRFLIDQDGTLKVPAYGAGFLTTDANGDVSVDTTSYVDSSGDTMTGDLTIKRGHGDLTFLTLKQENTGGDLVEQKSFIDFTFVDSNTNETPQVRIGAEVGNNDGSASSLSEEGMGAFVVYTNNADTDAGAAGTSLAERFRVDRQGRVGIGTANPAQKLHVVGDIYTTSDFRGNSIISTNAALTISNTGIIPDQGDVEDIVAFNWSTTKVAHIDTDGYIHATGFKTSGTTGFLKSDGSVDTGSYLTSVAFSDITGKPTTLSGYGITDGATVDYVDQETSGLASESWANTNLVNVSGDTMTGDLIVPNLRSDQETSGTITNNNWYRVLELNGSSGRGKCEFILESNGGSGTPFSLRGAISTTWSAGDQTLTIHHNSLGSIKEMRVVRNSAGNRNYLDIKSSGEDFITFTILPHKKVGAEAIDFTDVTTLPSGDTVQDTVAIQNKTIVSQAGNYSAFTVDKDSSIATKNVNATGDATITGLVKASSYRLSSGNTAISEGSNFLYIDASGSFGSGVYINNKVKVDGGLLGSYNEDLQLRTGDTTRMTLSNSNGNVGIGTTSPGYTLDVNGSMHSTNITIADAIYHEGDTNTSISFGTDTINFNTGGGVRASISDSGAKFNNNTIIAGGATLSLGERAEGDDNGRTVLIEGAANAGSGEGAGRIFFTEHNSTDAAADKYGLSLYYEGDPNIALPSGFQPNTGNATWSLRRHDNSVNGVAIMSGSRSNSNVTFGGNLYVPNVIYHAGDTNTYMQFHAADQWRVVTGGVERLEVNNTYTTVANDFWAEDKSHAGDQFWKTKTYIRTVGVEGGSIADKWVHLTTVDIDAAYDKAALKFKIHGFDDVSCGTENIDVLYENAASSQETHRLDWYSTDGTASLFKAVKSTHSGSNLAHSYELWVQMAGDWRDTFTVEVETWTDEAGFITYSEAVGQATAPSGDSNDQSKTSREWYTKNTTIYADGTALQTQSQADSRYLQLTGGTVSGAVTLGAQLTLSSFATGVLRVDSGSVSVDTNSYLTSMPANSTVTSVTFGGVKVEEASDRPGLLEINRDGTDTWSGIMTKFSGTAEWALMGNETSFGLYDDQNNEWAFRYVENSYFEAYNNGSVKLQTASNGVKILNVLELGNLGDTNGGVLKLNGTTANKQAVIKCTNGNLHIDSEDGNSLYLNYYEGTSDNIIFGNGNGGASGAKVTSAGVVHATGGNSGNWNTAYSWGNHASAGYITSYTETDTLASVTGRGASTTTALSIRELTARNILPEADRTYNLGGEETRWRIVYCETLDSAGQHESNLQDEEQPIRQYATGTVLSWKGGKNRPCTQYADHMRMGIAVEGQDSPLIQGAEPVLVTGIVEEGDYLVTSEKEGHAVAVPRNIVKEQMLFDCVIGKALESGDGDSHLIKTWINI